MAPMVALMSDREVAQLRARYEQMTDDDLSTMYRRRELTPVAESVAVAVLLERGIVAEQLIVHASDTEPDPGMSILEMMKIEKLEADNGEIESQGGSSRSSSGGARRRRKTNVGVPILFTGAIALLLSGGIFIYRVKRSPFGDLVSVDQILEKFTQAVAKDPGGFLRLVFEAAGQGVTEGLLAAAGVVGLVLGLVFFTMNAFENRLE